LRLLHLRTRVPLPARAARCRARLLGCAATCRADPPVLPRTFTLHCTRTRVAAHAPAGSILGSAVRLDCCGCSFCYGYTGLRSATCCTFSSVLGSGCRDRVTLVRLRSQTIHSQIVLPRCRYVALVRERCRCVMIIGLRCL